MASTKNWIARIPRLAWVTGATLALVGVLLVASGQRLSSQGSNVGELGLDGYQFAGHIDQNGTAFIGYGYIYDIQGIAPTALFSDPYNPSAETAHFTYYATASLTSRAVLTDAVRGIFALDSLGEINFYYQETPGASFDDPESFAQGEDVTSASLRLQDILTVTGPNRGLASSSGDFDVLTATSFEFGGDTVRFGRPGRRYRVSTFGDAVRSDALIPQSSVLLAGSADGAGSNQAFLPHVNRAGNE
jgi:hypothetical protein